MKSSVVIIGAGPAGLSAAIFLRRKGLDVLVLERQDKSGDAAQSLVGESLPPGAKGLLEQLDVWEEFSQGPHLECYGNKSYWHSQHVRYHDFMLDPVGHGWHIDRAVFETMLRDKARRSGATLVEQVSKISATRQQAHWEVTFDAAAEQHLVHAAFILDATGRSSWFARRQGIPRVYEDRQLALTAFCVHHAAFEDTTSLVETTPQGWWYSAKIPGERLALAFFCKPDATQRELWLQEREFDKLLAQAPHTRARFDAGKCRLLDAPKFVAADSGLLEQMHGEGWLAIGDAAMTYDPIASHGLVMAMTSARDASEAVTQYLQGVDSAPQAYAAVLWLAFQRYSAIRQSFYA